VVNFNGAGVCGESEYKRGNRQVTPCLSALASLQASRTGPTFSSGMRSWVPASPSGAIPAHAFPPFAGVLL
jgi:hypothetical protein